MVEHRIQTRARTQLSGRAALDVTSGETLSCLVRNLSATGACVSFWNEVAVPDSFDLFVESSKRAYRVSTVWRRANEVGIRFAEPRTNAPEVLSEDDLPGEIDPLPAVATWHP